MSQRDGRFFGLLFGLLFSLACAVPFRTHAQQGWHEVLPASDTRFEYFKGASFADSLCGTAVGLEEGHRLNAIYRTTDGGATWAAQLTDSVHAFNSVHVISRDEAFVTGAHVLLHTTDQGMHWTPDPIADTCVLNSITFHGQTGLAVGEQGNVLRTTDGGRHWDLTASGCSDLLKKVVFVDSSIAVIVGYGHGILRSSDAGASWSPAIATTYTECRDVSFVSPTFGMACGWDAWRTYDAGRTWQRKSMGSASNPSFIGFADSARWFLASEGGSLIFASNDAGDTWAENAYLMEVVEAIAPISPHTALIVGWNGLVLRAENGTESMKIIRGAPGTEAAGAIVFSGQTAWAFGGWCILKSTDAGAHWAYVRRPGTIGALTMAAFADSANVVLGNTGSSLIHTTDGGAGWRVHTTPLFHIRGIAFPNVRTVYIIGDSGRVARSDNGGKWWSLLETGTRCNLRGIVCTDSLTCTVVGDDGIALRTTDGGEHWNRLVVPTTADLICVSFHGPNVGTIVTADGFVYHTTDGGALWMLQYTGVNLHAVHATVIDSLVVDLVCGPRQPPDNVSRIFRSTDGGATWNLRFVAPQGTALISTAGIAALSIAVGTRNHSSDGRLYPFLSILATTDGGITFTPSVPVARETPLLEQNAPNPFARTTTLRVTLPRAGHASLRVYNLLGAEVAVLLDGPADATTRMLTWNAAALPPGVYFAVLRSGTHTETRKMILAP